jgi:hypothetical protein
VAYTDEYDLFADTTNALHKKVARAIDVAARDVVNEAPATPNHEIRLVWANWMRAAPDRVVAEAHRAMLRVLDNASVAAAGNAATDNDVQFVINALVDTLATGGYR